MEYIIVAFRSRAHTMRFYEFIKNHGINCEIINTPKEAGVGCGLSVRTSLNLFPSVKRATFSMGLSSFAGFFLVKTVGGKRFVKSI